MAREFDVGLDFDLDPSWRHMDDIARQTIAHGMQVRMANLFANVAQLGQTHDLD
ncbi:hypothetical protein [Poseidonocella pacifica]|uniref:hypothetical protein n=1 Tax=Poseidonocella pacifica TaxID=871651 RepID=UPI001FDFD43C|nr:hypothetical protein [Poseidonocella pacifica]